MHSEVSKNKSFSSPLKKQKVAIKRPPYFLYILLAVAFAFYFNSLFNEYAFDDYTYVVENSYVQQGFKGVGKLFASDALEGFLVGKGALPNELSGGRYRPLSLVTFAIEKQLFGNSPLLSHSINVILYVLTAIFIFNF